MAKVEWIKIKTDMFDNRKVKHLRKLPEGNNIVLIWVMLLTMAGRCNAKGEIFLTENIPYTTKMLADELGFDENVIKMALSALEQFDMIVTGNGFLAVCGWEEHQNIDALEKIREQGRIRKQRQRERERIALLGCVTGQGGDSHGTEEEEETEKDNKTIDYKGVVDLFNSICSSLPSVRALSESRKKEIKDRFKTYGMDDFKLLFQKAEASDFLKGKNERRWLASFDWLIKDENMAKVLDGLYENRPVQQKAEKKNSFHNFEQRTYDYDALLAKIASLDKDGGNDEHLDDGDK